jgi:hypothetical protein
MTASLVASLGTADALAAPFVVHRVNAGGPAIAPDWEADTLGSPSEFENSATTQTFDSASTVDLSDPSVPPDTPEPLFDSERWDMFGTPEHMVWNFPVTPGPGHIVRLYFAETVKSGAGLRNFDVTIEGTQVLDNYDIAADVGINKAVVKEYPVTSADGTITVDFDHGNADNPTVKAIEVLSEPSTTSLSAAPGRADFGNVTTGATRTRPIVITNNGATPATIDSTSITGAGAGLFSDDFNDSGSVQVPAGGSTTIQASVSPTDIGPAAAVLSVTHSGADDPLRVKLRVDGQQGGTVAFEKSALAGASSNFPTALQWGPDGRLYVAEFLSDQGSIKAYTVQKNGPNAYAVTSTEQIDDISAIPNHDDNGAVNASPLGTPGYDPRLITGLLVTGTAANPVLYVTSSDPRISGGGASGTDTNLDTNSSVISRLNRVSGTWHRTDLVRGLPRSEENHAVNGLALDTATNTLFVGQGGNTNKGAPSNNFAFLPEYAYSAAILSVDLDSPELSNANAPYDLPTLDDEDKPNVPSPTPGYEDATDPFGGNNGKNQAKIVPGSPVQVYGSGFRNPYDVVWTTDNKLFAIDNGANADWGSFPVDQGPGCTNAVQDLGTSDSDALHLVTPGYYGGPPNPTRANPANTFNTGPNAQSPVSAAHAIECDYRGSDTPESTALAKFASSTNGIDEYTASTFGGAMQGDLVAAGYIENKIFRIKRTADGTGVAANTTLVNDAGSAPLGIDALGDSEIFPGTIWIADQGGGGIYVLEPSTLPCVGDSDPGLDEDSDGFSNQDEVQNGTNPCSGADHPADADGDHVSNLNDPDDDNDGRPDTSDEFAVDAQNGFATNLPVDYQWENDSTPFGGNLNTYNLGFTGLMTNASANYRSLFDSTHMTEVGAAGVVTLDEAGPGDAAAALNTQTQAFQFGLNAPSSNSQPFEVSTRVLNPFSGGPPSGHESLGLFVGNGDQDNYVKIVAGSLPGAPSVGVRADREVAGVLEEGAVSAQALPIGGSGAKAIDLYLIVDPVLNTVRAEYATTANGALADRVSVGAPVPIPASWTDDQGQGLAIGIISTSRGGSPFPGSWDFITAKVVPRVEPPPVNPPATTPTTPIVTPPLPRFAFAKVASGQNKLSVKSGRTVSVLVQCPAQLTPQCVGQLELSTVKRYRAKTGKLASLLLGKRSFRIPQGKSARVTVKLTAAGRKLLKPGKAVKATIGVRMKNASGKTVLRKTATTLRAPKPKKR